MKCCIIAIYQYKNIEQKEFTRIVLFNVSARFENFATYCKENVKEMQSLTSHQIPDEKNFKLRFDHNNGGGYDLETQHTPTLHTFTFPTLNMCHYLTFRLRQDISNILFRHPVKKLMLTTTRRIRINSGTKHLRYPSEAGKLSDDVCLKLKT